MESRNLVIYVHEILESLVKTVPMLTLKIIYTPIEPASLRELAEIKVFLSMDVGCVWHSISVSDEHRRKLEIEWFEI